MSDPIAVAGELVELLPERALHWPRTATLLLADLHLGKDEFFRRSGIPVPAGGIDADLERLAMLIDRCAIERVVLLGDFVHATPAPNADFVRAFAAWRERYRRIEFIVVAGNHDKLAAQRELTQVEWCNEWLQPPFVGRHHPAESRDGYVLCGHVHPVMSMHSRRERMRLPVFWVTPTHAVLPSFGSFTGGAEIEPSPEDQVYAVAADRTWRVPPSR